MTERLFLWTKSVWDEVLEVFERQVLLFPVFVLVFACGTFVFGGRCAAWQWWGAVGLVLAVSSLGCKDWFVKIIAAFLFGIFLAIILVWIRISCDCYWIDSQAYHLPATQMLIEGWNPLNCTTPEQIGQAFHVEPWDMRVLHVIFSQKGVWIFNAVAFFFHRDPLALTIPCEIYVYAMLAVVFWRVLNAWHWMIRVGLLCVLHSRVCSYMAVVDDICAMSIFALMVVVAIDFEKSKISLLRLLSFSVLAMTAKSSGALAVVVVLLAFACSVLIKNRRKQLSCLIRLFALGISLALLFCGLNASPYYVASRDWGHPLYPFVTSDETRYPVYDFTGDLKMGNEDLRSMGAFSRFVNAYISPTLTQLWYRTLRQREFRPSCFVWRDCADPALGKDETCPTAFSERIILWLSLFSLLLMRRWRFVVFLALACLFCAPSHLYGYWRYFKWCDCLSAFAVFSAGVGLYDRFISGRLSDSCIAKVGVLGGVALSLVFSKMIVCFIMAGAIALDVKQAICNFRPTTVYCQLFGPSLIAFRKSQGGVGRLCEGFCTAAEAHCDGCFGSSSHVAINAVKFLSRRLPNLGEAQIVPLEENETTDYRFLDCLGIYVKKDEKPLPILISKYNGIPSRLRRYSGYVMYAINMWSGLMSRPMDNT